MIIRCTSFAQSIPELNKNPILNSGEIDSLSQISVLGKLKPVLYSENKGFITDLSLHNELQVYGCKGDFNNDKIIDYALILRDPIKTQDKLSVLITGLDTLYTLDTFPTLSEISENDPYSSSLSPPKCYEQSESGTFEGLYGKVHEMPGDLIRYGWYSYVWNNKNGFLEILTSD